MAAKTKGELLSLAEKEFDKLKRVLETVGDDQAILKDDDDTSIKDVVAHRAHWIDLFLGWYADGQTGKTAYFPAEGYKWNDLKRYNADIRARQSQVGFDEARAMLRDKHGTLLAFLRGLSEAELYGAPMKGANNDWVPGRWAEAVGPSHYRSAVKYIRSRLKAPST
jgi:hypothetical protein